MIPTYDAAGDVLHLLAIESSQVKDVSITWNIIATYTPEGELAELTLVDAKADSQKILMQALERIGRAGIAKADSALVITAAVMLRDFEAVPDFTELPEACRADAGYLLEYLVQTILTKGQADKVLMAIDRFKPECPNFQLDVLADRWGASCTMTQRPVRHTDLELVRGKAFVDRLQQELQAATPGADQPQAKRATAKWELVLMRSTPEDFFARGKEIARLAVQGAQLPTRIILSFEDLDEARAIDVLRTAEMGLRQVLEGKVLSEEALTRMLEDDDSPLPVVDVLYDSEARVWSAVGNTFPGVVAEAPTLDALIARIAEIIPDLATDFHFVVPVEYELRVVVPNQQPTVRTTEAQERWLRENKDAVESYNAYVERHGLPLARMHSLRAVGSGGCGARYDQATDALYIHLSDSPAMDSEEVAEGLVLDFDSAGTLVGLDVQNVTGRGAQPYPPELSETGSSHITPAGGNVFEDLGFPKDEAAQLKSDSQARIQRLPGAKSYLTRVRAAAEQLAGLATAKTDDFKLALLSSIDWQLVSEEFDSVVEKYAFSVERYASRLISNLRQLQLSNADVAELQVTMSDLTAHLEDFDDLAQVDAQVAEAWHDTLNELDVERGFVRDLPPILTLAGLQQACAEKLALDRRLFEVSQAYRDARTVPYDAVEDLLRVCAMSADDKVAALVGSADRAWKKTSTVLIRAARALDLTVSDEVLGELAVCLPQAVDAGLLETQGDLNKWTHSEIRVKGPAA